MHQHKLLTVITGLIFFILISNVQLFAAPEQPAKDRPNLYMDCWFCDMDYIKQEIPFVNYVRDRQDTDIHVMIARQSAANGGHKFTVFMIGKKQYSGRKDTLSYHTGPQASDDETRKEMVHALKTGLMPYLVRTPLWKDLSIQYNKEAGDTTEKTIDKWDNWVFELSMDGDMSGEASEKEIELRGSAEATRITKKWKMEYGFDYDYERSEYKVDGDIITSIHRTNDFDALVVKSFGPHWSAGGFARYYSSLYENLKHSYTATPALEFSFYPYAEASTRELTLLYRPQYHYNNYNDSTIYNKLSENLVSESLQFQYELEKEWGSIDVSLYMSHYFHDFSKNRIGLYARTDLNLVKGLSFYFSVHLQLLNDQISLKKGDASAQEVLLRQQQLQTNYTYDTRLGISYTFGSLYNNVVNTRF